MNNKLISHEVPLALLKDSLEFNDYQYALVHLFEKYPKYLEHFEMCRDTGQRVILDNSLFELGTAFDIHTFRKWVVRMRPTEYIIPDAFGDTQTTLENAQKWMELYSDTPGMRIGVIQGDNFVDYVNCYRGLLEAGVQKIAISFGYPSYTKALPGVNKDLARMMGRFDLIERLIDCGIIDYDIPHHLLGVSLPQEFSIYKSRRYSFFESLDTSNPVLHGIHEIKYKSGVGLLEKIDVKMADMMEVPIEGRAARTIYYNIEEFKKLVNHED